MTGYQRVEKKLMRLDSSGLAVLTGPSKLATFSEQSVMQFYPESTEGFPDNT